MQGQPLGGGGGGEGGPNGGEALLRLLADFQRQQATAANQQQGQHQQLTGHQTIQQQDGQQLAQQQHQLQQQHQDTQLLQHHRSAFAPQQARQDNPRSAQPALQEPNACLRALLLGMQQQASVGLQLLPAIQALASQPPQAQPQRQPGAVDAGLLLTLLQLLAAASSGPAQQQQPPPQLQQPMAPNAAAWMAAAAPAAHRPEPAWRQQAPAAPAFAGGLQQGDLLNLLSLFIQEAGSGADAGTAPAAATNGDCRAGVPDPSASSAEGAAAAAAALPAAARQQRNQLPPPFQVPPEAKRRREGEDFRHAGGLQPLQPPASAQQQQAQQLQQQQQHHHHSSQDLHLQHNHHTQQKLAAQQQALAQQHHQVLAHLQQQQQQQQSGMRLHLEQQVAAAAAALAAAAAMAVRQGSPMGGLPPGGLQAALDHLLAGTTGASDANGGGMDQQVVGPALAGQHTGNHQLAAPAAGQHPRGSGAAHMPSSSGGSGGSRQAASHGYGVAVPAPDNLRRVAMAALYGQPQEQVERSITNQTYILRLHVTTQMAQLLFPPRSDLEAAHQAAQAHDVPPATSSRLGSSSTYTQLFKQRLTVVDESGRAWPVQYEGFLSSGQRHYRLTSGWVGLMRAQQVAIGDTLVLERWTDDRWTIHLNIRRKQQEQQQGLQQQQLQQQGQPDAADAGAGAGLPAAGIPQPVLQASSESAVVQLQAVLPVMITLAPPSAAPPAATPPIDAHTAAAAISMPAGATTSADMPASSSAGPAAATEQLLLSSAVGITAAPPAAVASGAELLPEPADLGLAAAAAAFPAANAAEDVAAPAAAQDSTAITDSEAGLDDGSTLHPSHTP